MRRRRYPPPPPYEGRIRPSLIAAVAAGEEGRLRVGLRGANSPLPHCGTGPAAADRATQTLRGANSPLPHCGNWKMPVSSDVPRATRGEFAPPSLRPVVAPLRYPFPIRLRGANSPLPHCGTGSAPGRSSAWWLRGANSPLPHCGSLTSARRTIRLIATRGEFAPPSLRPVPRKWVQELPVATRGEFAPPSLRHGQGCSTPA